MHLRRAAQAPSPSFALPQGIRNGNSSRNFSARLDHNAEPCLYKNYSKMISEVCTLFRSALLNGFFIWIILFLVAFMIPPSRAQISGTLKEITIALKDSSAGVGTIYFISFKADSGLERDDKILLHFPQGKGFDISAAVVANNQSGLDGGFIVSRDLANEIVGIQRDGQGIDLPAGVTGSLRLAIVGNPPKPGSYDYYPTKFPIGLCPSQSRRGHRHDQAWTFRSFHFFFHHHQPNRG